MIRLFLILLICFIGNTYADHNSPFPCDEILKDGLEGVYKLKDDSLRKLYNWNDNEKLIKFSQTSSTTYRMEFVQKIDDDNYKGMVFTLFCGKPMAGFSQLIMLNYKNSCSFLSYNPAIDIGENLRIEQDSKGLSISSTCGKKTTLIKSID